MTNNCLIQNAHNEVRSVKCEVLVLLMTYYVSCF